MSKLREWDSLPVALLVIVARLNERACSRAIREIRARLRLAEAETQGDSDEQISKNLEATTPLYRALGQIVYQRIEALPAKESLRLSINSSTEREKRAFIDFLMEVACGPEQDGLDLPVEE